ncbi:RdRp [Wenling crustacean virus 1]|uniref:RdRp n=1 Tax=Wenling crustacean virus 1 TaxID=1923478 RepID=UPI00090C6090|nr:RdRp [Wenling crustacean virus 1]APG77808.1 RdRp [Wenling crustacean virus 1]
MDSITSGLPPQIANELNEDLTPYYREHINGLLQDTTTLPFKLTARQLEHANAVYQPCVFRCEFDGNYVNHYIAKAAEIIGERILEHIAERNVATTEIGCGSDRLISGCDHGCSSMSSLDSSRRHSKNTSRLDHKTPGTPSCTLGAQNCNHPAKILVANQVYDLTPRQWYEAFEKKGAECAYVALLSPHGLHTRQDHRYEEYGLMVNFIGNNIIMGFEGGEHCYTHNIDTWEWLTEKGGYNGPKFSLSVETITRLGPLAIMRITKVTQPGIIINSAYLHNTDFVQLIDLLHEFPKIYHLSMRGRIGWARHGKHTDIQKHIGKMRKIVIPRKIYDKVMQYCQLRDDAKYERQGVIAYIRALMTRIHVGHHHVQVGFEILGEDFATTLANLYIHACLERMLVTKSIGKMVKFFSEDPGFIEKLANELLPMGERTSAFLAWTFKRSNRSTLSWHLCRLYEIFRVHENGSRFLAFECSAEPIAYRPYSETHAVPMLGEDFCLARSIATLVNGHPRYHTLHTARHEYDLTPEIASHLEIEGNHCRPIVTHATHCKHGIGRVLNIPQQEGDYYSSEATFHNELLHGVMKATGAEIAARMALHQSHSYALYTHTTSFSVPSFGKIEAEGGHLPNPVCALCVNGLPNNTLVILPDNGGNRRVTIAEVLCNLRIGDTALVQGIIQLLAQPSGDNMRLIEQVRRFTVSNIDRDWVHLGPGENLLDCRYVSSTNLEAAVEASEERRAGFEGEAEEAFQIDYQEPQPNESSLFEDVMARLEHLNLQSQPEFDPEEEPVDAMSIQEEPVGVTEQDVEHAALHTMQQEFTQPDLVHLADAMQINQPTTHKTLEPSYTPVSPAGSYHDTEETNYHVIETVDITPKLSTAAILHHGEWCSTNRIAIDGAPCSDNQEVIVYQGDQPLKHYDHEGTLSKFDKEGMTPRARAELACFLGISHYTLTPPACLKCFAPWFHTTLNNDDTRFKDVRLRVSAEVVQETLDNLRHSLKTKPTEPFYEVHKQAIALLKGTVATVIDRNVKCMRGYAGSGKTTYAKERLGKAAVFVTPTGALRREYTNTDYNACTTARFITRTCKRKKVLFDEVFLLHPGIILLACLNDNDIHMIGDPAQNRYGSSDFQANTSIDQLLRYPTEGLDVSHSVPQDVCAWLHRFQHYRIHTRSEVEESVKIHYGAPSANDVICFTTKRAEVSSRKGWQTAATCQGMRKERTTVFIETNAKELLKNCPEQLLVALTRHTERCDLYVAHEGLARALHLDNFHKHYCELRGIKPFKSGVADHQFLQSTLISGAEARLEQTKEGENVTHTIPDTTHATLVAYDVPIMGHDTAPEYTEEDELDRQAQPCVHEPRDDPLFPLDFPEPMASQVEECMQKIAPTSADPTTSKGPTDIHAVRANHGRVDIVEKGNHDPIGHEGTDSYHTIDMSLRGRPVVNRSAGQRLNTIVERYSTKPALSRRQEATMKELCRDHIHSVYEPFKISVEEVGETLAEQLDRIHAKDDRDNMVDLDPAFKQSFDKIKCFIKQQTKADLKPNSFLSIKEGYIKGGQGISAQSKAVNLVTGAFVRAFEKKLVHNLNHRYVYCPGLSPKELSHELEKKGKYWSTGLEADISQFDSLRGRWADQLMREMYRSAGIDVIGTRLMQAFNEHWVFDAGNITASIRDHFQSGRCDTLLSNTLICMLMIRACYNIQGLRLAAHQGDDSLILARRIRWVGPAFLKPFIKSEFSMTPSIVGFIFYDRLYINFPRMVAKLGNRTFSDLAQLKAYQEAVLDWLKPVYTTQLFHANSVVVSHKYNISVEESHMLGIFLARFATEDTITVWKSLKKYIHAPRIQFGGLKRGSEQ